MIRPYSVELIFPYVFFETFGLGIAFGTCFGGGGGLLGGSLRGAGRGAGSRRRPGFFGAGFGRGFGLAGGLRSGRRDGRGGDRLCGVPLIWACLDAIFVRSFVSLLSSASFCGCYFLLSDLPSHR